MDRTLDSVGNGYRMGNLEDINGWIGDRTRPAITDVILEFQERMIRVEEWWSFVQKGTVCVGNTHFMHRSLYK